MDGFGVYQTLTAAILGFTADERHQKWFID
jgi:hypothetical protein